MITVDFASFDKKGLKPIADAFNKAGLPVSTTEASNKPVREAGYQVKSATLTLESGQVVILKAKAGGSLYQSKLNGKLLAIKDYLTPDKFIAEVIAYAKSNEANYLKQKEKQLSKVKVLTPKIKPVSMTIAEQTQAYTATLAEIQGQTESVNGELQILLPAVAVKNATLTGLQVQLKAENEKSAALQKELDGLSSGILESAEADPTEELDVVTESATGDGVKPKMTVAQLQALIEKQKWSTEDFIRDLKPGDKTTIENGGTGEKVKVTIMEAAGTAPVEIDRMQIAQSILKGGANHPDLAAAFLEGFNNSCDINDAITFIDSFSDAELMGFLKAEEHVLESATSVAITSNGERTGTLTPEQFRKGIDAPKSMFLGDVIKRFNENKEKAGEPERAEQVLECAECSNDECIGMGEGNEATGISGEGAEDVGEATYAIRTETVEGNGNTTILSPIAYPLPITQETSNTGADNRHQCKECGAEILPQWTGQPCPFCGIILEAIPEILDQDKGGYHDANDPDHVNDPDKYNYGGAPVRCPWCDSQVSENVCTACNRKVEIAATDRREWEAANKPLAKDDNPANYE